MILWALKQGAGAPRAALQAAKARGRKLGRPIAADSCQGMGSLGRPTRQRPSVLSRGTRMTA